MTDELPVCAQCGQRHAPRGGYIGSGDAAAIIGVSDPERRTAVQVYRSKVEPSAEVVEPNEAMQRGLILEPVILDAFERARGLKVVDRQMFREIPGLRFPIGSHIDGRIAETGDLVEAKSAAFGLRDNWGDAGSADLPEDYLCQAAHHLAVWPEAPGIWQPVMFVGFSVKLEWFYVPRDAQFVKDIVDAEVAFADKHLIPRVPPPAVTAADVKRIFPKDLGTSVEASLEVALAVSDLKHLRARSSELEKQDKLLEGQIAAAIGPNAMLTFQGKPIATFKTKRRASYVAKATEYRELRLKK